MYWFYSCWLNHHNSFHINHFQYFIYQSYYFKAPLKISHKTTQMLAPLGHVMTHLDSVLVRVPILVRHLTTRNVIFIQNSHNTQHNSGAFCNICAQQPQYMIYKNYPSFKTLMPEENLFMVCKSVFRLKSEDAEHDHYPPINIEHFSETGQAQFRFNCNKNILLFLTQSSVTSIHHVLLHGATPSTS